MALWWGRILYWHLTGLPLVRISKRYIPQEIQQDLDSSFVTGIGLRLSIPSQLQIIQPTSLRALHTAFIELRITCNPTDIIESASYSVYRVTDNLAAIPYGTGSDLSTYLSYDKEGNFFDLDMSLLECLITTTVLATGKSNLKRLNFELNDN
jgi:hypothetical protein